MMRKQVGLATLAAAGLLALSAGAAGPGIGNGGFETGGFSPWKTKHKGDGNWLVYEGTSSPRNGFPLPEPPEGDLAAVSDQDGPGSNILYQTIRLKGTSEILSFTLYYRNLATDGGSPAPIRRYGPTPRCAPAGGPKVGCSSAIFCSPKTLKLHDACNQQYRVDILRDGADPFTTGRDVLRTLFQTQPGDDAELPPTVMTFDLHGLPDRVILRFAEVDNQFYFNAAVDDVHFGVL